MKTKPTPLPQSRQAFLEWYNVATAGQILQTLEASYLQSALKLTYNQRTLQVGRLGSETLYIDSDFMGDFILLDVDSIHAATPARRISATADELPIASESVDTLILPHIIEFAIHRHQILREVERVLKPEGRLFILGLNPWSPHRIIQHLPRNPHFWRTNFVSRQRLLDWLSLLKFDAELSAFFSVSSSRISGKPTTAWAQARAELSYAYALKAIKRQFTLIPIEPGWVNVPSLATGHMFEKSS
jgi:SAM-dependent methyltransferase